MKKENSCIERMKEDYNILKKKYNLPDFDKLNRDFEIEKVSERETEHLLREIRKIMAEKEIVVLRFLEMMLNPSNAPFFIFSIIKNMSGLDKKVIERIYTNICEFELRAISLDLMYDEKKEAEFIKDASKRWNEMSGDLKEFSSIISKSWKISNEKAKKDYLG